MKQLRELMKLMEKQKKNASPARAGSKTLNDTLKTRKGGAHYSPQSDYVRAKEKSKLRKELNEELGTKYFRYTVWIEEKDYGDGRGGDRSVDGVTSGPNAEEVTAKLKSSHRRAYSVELKEISKEAFDKARASDD